VYRVANIHFVLVMCNSQCYDMISIELAVSYNGFQWKLFWYQSILDSHSSNTSYHTSWGNSTANGPETKLGQNKPLLQTIELPKQWAKPTLV